MYACCSGAVLYCRRQRRMRRAHQTRRRHLSVFLVCHCAFLMLQGLSSLPLPHSTAQSTSSTPGPSEGPLPQRQVLVLRLQRRHRTAVLSARAAAWRWYQRRRRFASATAVAAGAVLVGMIIIGAALRAEAPAALPRPCRVPLASRALAVAASGRLAQGAASPEPPAPARGEQAGTGPSWDALACRGGDSSPAAARGIRLGGGGSPAAAAAAAAKGSLSRRSCWGDA